MNNGNSEIKVRRIDKMRTGGFAGPNDFPNRGSPAKRAKSPKEKNQRITTIEKSDGLGIRENNKRKRT